MKEICVREIAYARSGDKGNSANIGVVAYTIAGYELLQKQLTADVVKAYFQPLGVVSVTRYVLPNLCALNFVCRGILGGGASRSLRCDSQGKALGQALLEIKLVIPKENK